VRTDLNSFYLLKFGTEEQFHVPILSGWIQPLVFCDLDRCFYYVAINLLVDKAFDFVRGHKEAIFFIKKRCNIGS